MDDCYYKAGMLICLCLLMLIAMAKLFIDYAIIERDAKRRILKKKDDLIDKSKSKEG